MADEKKTNQINNSFKKSWLESLPTVNHIDSLMQKMSYRPTQPLSEAYQLRAAQPIQTEDMTQNFDAPQLLQEGNPSPMGQDASRGVYIDSDLYRQWEKDPYEDGNATEQEIFEKRLKDFENFEKRSKDFILQKRAFLKRQGGRIINVYY